MELIMIEGLWPRDFFEKVFFEGTDYPEQIAGIYVNEGRFICSHHIDAFEITRIKDEANRFSVANFHSSVSKWAKRRFYHSGYELDMVYELEKGQLISYHPRRTFSFSPSGTRMYVCNRTYQKIK